MKNRAHIILRYAFVGLCILLFSGKIAYNMIDTTVIHNEEWNKLAMRELSYTKPIPPVRGKLLAADGRVLAANRRLYTIRIDFTSEQFRFTEYKKAIPELADSMARYFPVRDRKGWEERLNEPLNLRARRGNNKAENTRIDRQLRSWPLLLKIEWTEVERLKTFPFFKIKNSAKTGLVAEPTDDRVKPFGSLASRSIGIVAQDTSSTERHGRSGLEGSLDSLLYGVPGVSKKVALTKSIGNWTDIPAVPGYDVTTTIDIDMQDIVENELMKMLTINRADWGSAILMEVSTGNIRAISNFEYSSKTGNYEVCINRIFTPYEPGSVMKTVSMLIALEDGIVTGLNQSFPGHDGEWAYPNKSRAILDSHPMGWVPVSLILPNSSNIATAEMIMSRYRSNPSAFKQRLYDIGFGESLEVGIKGEKLPFLKANPSAVDLSRMAYGYTTAIPPIYTLTVYNAIANDGVMVRPRLYTRLERPDTVIEMPVTHVRDRICSEEHARMLQKMLRDVIEVPGATGYKVLHTCPIPIAGKTGTCYKVENRKYNTSKKRVAFCGFFPADNPKYSCFVFMEWPKVQYIGAASASGQVFKNIALKLHARGLLDNSSDYTLETHPGVKAQFNALPAGTAPYSAMPEALTLTSVAESTAPRQYGPGTVPDVTGLNLRHAVITLEEAGYNIKVTGEGTVKSQFPPGGTPAEAESEVILTLSPNVNTESAETKQ